MSTILGPFNLPLEKETRSEELIKRVEELWTAVQELQLSLLIAQKAAPPKLRDGMLRYADGVNWDPGAGAGVYQYRGGAWNKF